VFFLLFSSPYVILFSFFSLCCWVSFAVLLVVTLNVLFVCFSVACPVGGALCRWGCQGKNRQLDSVISNRRLSCGPTPKLRARVGRASFVFFTNHTCGHFILRASPLG